MRRLRFALIGAALAYFFDPQNGAARRLRAKERLAGLSNRRPQPELSDELVGQAQTAATE
jgi:hypothetical protein